MNAVQGTLNVSEANRREPTEQTQRIAKRLATLRRQRAISQSDLCQRVGLTQSMMSRYENGERRIPAELLAEFAVAISVSADELLGLKKVAAKNDQEMSDETKRLWKKFQQVSRLADQDQRAVMRLINSLSRAKAS